MKLRIASAAVIALALLLTGLLGGPIRVGAFQSPPPVNQAPSDYFATAGVIQNIPFSASVDMLISPHSPYHSMC